MEKIKFIVLEDEAKNKEEAIKICVDGLVKAGITDEKFADLCIEREKETPTGIPTEIPIAIPHTKYENINEDCICVLKLKAPVSFYRMDDDQESVETSLIFNIAIKNPDQHIIVLQKMMEFFNDSKSLEKIKTLENEELIKYLEDKIG